MCNSLCEGTTPCQEAAPLPGPCHLMTESISCVTVLCLRLCVLEAPAPPCVSHSLPLCRPRAPSCATVTPSPYRRDDALWDPRAVGKPPSGRPKSAVLKSRFSCQLFFYLQLIVTLSASRLASSGAETVTRGRRGRRGGTPSPPCPRTGA